MKFPFSRRPVFLASRFRKLRYLPYFVLAATAAAAPFAVEVMPNPPGVDPQIGGLDALPDGKVAAAFHRGEVMVFDPAAKSWKKFAEGLHEPLGLVAESPASFLVMQRAELTRLKDTDGDGRADEYETVFDDFGLTGNYHEFAFGPARGPDGSLYIALNVASNGAGIREEIRGKWSEIGDLDFQQMIHGEGWGKRAGKAGRMYARVPWRGWVLRISPDGKTMEPYAGGFRSPDGIGVDGDGNVLVTDNQGDWRGTSPLHVVRKGGFHGHPASLVWQQGWDRGDPLKLPVAQLDAMRVKESARFPQGDLANSPTQPLPFPETWGPFAGQVLIGEMNQKRMVRYLPDDVAGFRQGTLIPIFDDIPLGNGNHRHAFGRDGALWVGKTHLSWAGAEGLVKITPSGLDTLFTVKSVKLERAGGGHALRISFSRPVKAGSGGVTVKRFDYLYHKAYGSPKTDEATVAVEGSATGSDGRELVLALEAKRGAIHEIDLSSLRDAAGAALEGKTLYYQASELP
jgi:glucose/arabinose dehydrogenase